MIQTFKSKSFSELFATGKSPKIDHKMHQRILIRLDVLNDAVTIEDLRLPGYSFHPLSGFNPPRYSIHVNGPWCLTFEFDNGDAYRVDFEKYH